MEGGLSEMLPLELLSHHPQAVIQMIIGIILITVGASIAKWMVRILGAILIILGAIALI